MHSAAINRFPLLGRRRPPCPALPERVHDIADTAHIAAPSGPRWSLHAKNVLTMAALIASDCGMPDLARGPCWQHINDLVVGDLDAEITRLRDNGLSFRSDLVAGPGGRQILLADPAGNLIERVARLDVSRQCGVVLASDDQLPDLQGRARAWCSAGRGTELFGA